jgi:cytochrome c peroxidase
MYARSRPWSPPRQPTTEEREQSETDGKPLQSGTATRSEKKYRQLYQGAHDCIPCHNGPRRATSSRRSGDSSSDDDRKPSLRRQNAIRRRRSQRLLDQNLSQES